MVHNIYTYPLGDASRSLSVAASCSFGTSCCGGGAGGCYDGSGSGGSCSGSSGGAARGGGGRGLVLRPEARAAQRRQRHGEQLFLVARPLPHLLEVDAEAACSGAHVARLERLAHHH